MRPSEPSSLSVRLICFSQLTSITNLRPVRRHLSSQPPSDFFHQRTASHDRESSNRTRRFVLSNQMRQVWKNELEGEFFPSMRSDHYD